MGNRSSHPRKQIRQDVYFRRFREQRIEHWSTERLRDVFLCLNRFDLDNAQLACKKFHATVYSQTKLVCLRRIDLVLFMQMNASGGDGDDDGLARYYFRIRRELAVNSDITINCGQAELVAKLAPYLRDAVIVERIEFSPGLSQIEPVEIYINHLRLSEDLIDLLRQIFRRTCVTGRAGFIKWRFQQSVSINDFLNCFAQFAAKMVDTDDLQGWYDHESNQMLNVLDDSALIDMRQRGVRGLDIDMYTIPYALTTSGVFDFCFNGQPLSKTDERSIRFWYIVDMTPNFVEELVKRCQTSEFRGTVTIDIVIQRTMKLRVKKYIRYLESGRIKLPRDNIDMELPSRENFNRFRFNRYDTMP